MSIIIPILLEHDIPFGASFVSVSSLEADLGGGQEIEVLFSSASTLTAALTHDSLYAAVFQSNSALSATLNQGIQGTAIFSSISELLADLRLNNEPNIFPAAVFGSESEFTIEFSQQQQLIATFLSTSNLSADLMSDSAPDFGFTIFIDILDSAIVTAQSGRIRRYTARLLVDGNPVPIRKAELEAAPDTLGTELRVTLARPNVAQITLSAEITFQIGLWTGAAYHYIPVITGGRLSARSLILKNTDERPTDEVTVSIIDVIANRWNRAPRVPTLLYDPNLIDAPTQSEIAAQKIVLENGGEILPISIPIPGMRLQNVLTKAYVDGTGFASVTTNIPNFPVSQVNFTLDGGYDSGIRPILSLFAPLLFADQSDNLSIIDPDAPLPAGLTPRDLLVSDVIQLTDSMPQREPVSAILIQMRNLDGGGEVSTDRLEQDHQESGVFGTPSFTQTDIERRVREFRQADNPLVIVREEIINEISTTLNWQLNVLERTTRVEHFDALGRKIGYSRRSDMRLPDLMSAFVDPVINSRVMPVVLLTDVVVQEQTIIYKQNPLNPNEDIQDLVITVESGLVLVDPDNQYNQNDFKIPLLDAHRTGYISPEGGQSVEHADIRTTIEQLRVRGDQVDVEVRVMNHISDAPIRSNMTSRPGSVTLDRRKQGSSRTVLLTIPGTEADGRRAQVFNAGELPPDIAMELGRRRLNRLNSPPRQIVIPPAFVDLGVRRGTIIRPKGRDNVALGVYIVTGFTITIDEFTSQRGVNASMTITARELTA